MRLLTTFKYHSVSADTQELVACMTTCIERVRCWMANNHLRLNPTKTELIWLSSPHRANLLSTSPIRLFGTVIQPSQFVLDLGVVVDSDLSLSAHVSHHQRVLLLSASATTCSTISDHGCCSRSSSSSDSQPSRLLQQSACWSTYGQMSRLQSVLRAAARLVLGLPGRAPVSAVGFENYR